MFSNYSRIGYSPAFLFPPFLSIYPCGNSLSVCICSIYVLFFYICVYIYPTVCVLVCVYPTVGAFVWLFLIYKYTLISLYNVTGIYDFKAEHLIWDNQFESSSLGKTVSLAVRFLVLFLLLLLRMLFKLVIWLVCQRLKAPGIPHF